MVRKSPDRLLLKSAELANLRETFFAWLVIRLVLVALLSRIRRLPVNLGLLSSEPINLGGISAVFVAINKVYLTAQ